MTFSLWRSCFYGGHPCLSLALLLGRIDRVSGVNRAKRSRQTGHPKRRPLRFEPLESRQLLSVGTPALPTLNIADAAAAAGSLMKFTVSLSNAATQSTEVDYVIWDGTAKYTVDYLKCGGEVTIPKGSPTASFTVYTYNNSNGGEAGDDGGDLTFNVTVEPSDDYVVGTGTAIGTIKYPSPAAIPKASVPNPRYGWIVGVDQGSVANVQVSLSSPATANVLVDYDVGGGDAVAGVDYDDVTKGHVMIPAGQQCGEIEIATHGDPANTNFRDLSVSLTGASGAVIDPTNATATVQIGWMASGDSGAAGATLNFLVASPWENGDKQPVSLEYWTSDCDDGAGRDYVSTSGTLTFDSDQPQVVSVKTLDDTIHCSTGINDAGTGFSLDGSWPNDVGVTVTGVIGNGTILADNVGGSMTIYDAGGDVIPHPAYASSLGNVWLATPGNSGDSAKLTINGYTENPLGQKFALDYNPSQVLIYTDPACTQEVMPGAAQIADSTSTTLYLKATSLSINNGVFLISLDYNGNVLDSVAESVSAPEIVTASTMDAGRPMTFSIMRSTTAKGPMCRLTMPRPMGRPTARPSFYRSRSIRHRAAPWGLTRFTFPATFNFGPPPRKAAPRSPTVPSSMRTKPSSTSSRGPRRARARLRSIGPTTGLRPRTPTALRSTSLRWKGRWTFPGLRRTTIMLPVVTPAIAIGCRRPAISPRAPQLAPVSRRSNGTLARRSAP